MVKLNLPKTKETKVLANPLKRMAAFLIDLLLMQLIVVSTFSEYFKSAFPKQEGGFLANYAYMQMHQGALYSAYYAMISMGVIVLVYFTYMEYKYGQTIGKMVMKLHVESTVSKELGFFQCMLSNIFLIPIFPIFILWVVDPLYLLFKGERLSDVFSKTKLVEVIKDGY